MPEFTPHQDAALNAVASLAQGQAGQARTRQLFRLFGYAGTGKTTLARHLAERRRRRGPLRGLHRQGRAGDAPQGLRRRVDHPPLIYRARESGEETPNFELWDDAPASKAKLIVIDECSMVDAELGRDLLVLRRAGAGAGRSGAASADQGRRLLHRGRARRDAHRGAPAGAGRSDRAAVDGRARGPAARTSATTARRRWSRKRDLDPQRVLEADQVLVGRNDTRRAYNTRLRERNGFDRGDCRCPATSSSACATTGARGCSTAACGGEGAADHSRRLP